MRPVSWRMFLHLLPLGVVVVSADEGTLEALIGRLKSDGPRMSELQCQAAEALGEMGAKAALAVPALIAALEGSTSDPTRRVMAHALGEIGAQADAAVPALIALLEHSSTRAVAIDALVKIRNKVVPALIEALGNGQHATRGAAAAALGKLGDQAATAVPALIAILEDAKRYVATHRSAAVALGEIGVPAAAAVPALTRAVQRPQVREAGAQALELILGHVPMVAPVRERRAQAKHPAYSKPELLATGPNQVWSWDITRLLGPEKWTYYYLYVLLDIFSRYAVGWLVADRESAQLAVRLIEETCQRHGVRPEILTLHSDRGTPMTSKCTAQLLADLGVTQSLSRPQVSDDNPYSEAQFKTLKYHPTFPSRFASCDEALGFCRGFFSWYNVEHRHGGIALLTPEDVQYGRAEHVLARRHDVLGAAYKAHPERFTRGRPALAKLSTAVWINAPTADADRQAKAT